jgi:hypothetical protein
VSRVADGEYPTALNARTVNPAVLPVAPVYVVEGRRPEIPRVVDVVVAPQYPALPFTLQALFGPYTSYPVAPVDGAHDNVIALQERFVAVSPVGVGGTVDPPEERVVKL